VKQPCRSDMLVAKELLKLARSEASGIRHFMR